LAARAPKPTGAEIKLAINNSEIDGRLTRWKSYRYREKLRKLLVQLMSDVCFGSGLSFERVAGTGN
jgi:hypothetical protein